MKPSYSVRSQLQMSRWRKEMGAEEEYGWGQPRALTQEDMLAGNPHCGTWRRFDDPLLYYVIAQALRQSPDVAVPLLQVNSTFHYATARALYEELYVQDDDSQHRAPPPKTRLETILLHPGKYARFVQSFILVPGQNEQSGANFRQGDDMRGSSQGIQPDNIGLILQILPRLQAFVWASDRMPFRSICSVIHQYCPTVIDFLVRPTNSELAHSYTRAAMTEGGTSSAPTITHRWDAFMLQNLDWLKVVSISGLSYDGIRELQKFVQQARQLQHLAIDSQFIDDTLLEQIALLRVLRTLLLKSSGTKMTDRGVQAILETSETLQSLTLTEVEGRLNKSFWTRLSFLPPTFHTLNVALNEESPHHSWVSDHLGSIFNVLELAPKGLQNFTVTRLTPGGDTIPVTSRTQENAVLKDDHEEDETATVLKRVFSRSCDEVILPREFPMGAIHRIIEFGRQLHTLQVDFFTMKLDDLRTIVETCKGLQLLRILIDAPLSKVLSVSSSFVALTSLHTLILAVTDIHCPQHTLIYQPKGKASCSASISSSTTSSPTAKRGSVTGLTTTELSPEASVLSPLQSEPDSSSICSSPRLPLAAGRRRSLSNSTSLALQNAVNGISSGQDNVAALTQQGLRGSVGSFDTSVPPKREIRKFARRCPSLQIIRWVGRTGKGEWRIAAGSSSIHVHIDFIPIHLVEDTEAEQLTLNTGADVERFLVSKRRASMPHPGRRMEEIDPMVALAREGGVQLAEGKARRLDGKQFPRLRSTSGSGPKSPESVHREKGHRRSKSIVLEDRESGLEQTGGHSDESTSLFTGKGANEKQAKTAVKSYASVSSSASRTTTTQEDKRESKMTVLGELNGKREGRGEAKGEASLDSDVLSMTRGTSARRNRKKSVVA